MCSRCRAAASCCAGALTRLSASTAPTPPYRAPVGHRMTRTVWMTMKRSSRSEEHTSELQSLMRISYAVFCLKKKKRKQIDSVPRHSRSQPMTKLHHLDNRTEHTKQQHTQ